jgi:hypothetical protein
MTLPGRRGVVPIGREDVEQALAQLEGLDRDAANLLRSYLRGLESRLEAYQLGDCSYSQHEEQIRRQIDAAVDPRWPEK